MVPTVRPLATPNPRDGCEGGSVLVATLLISMVAGLMVGFFMSNVTTEARATRWRMGSVQALYQAYGELSKAKLRVANSPYDTQYQNEVLRDAVAAADQRIPGTDVEVTPLTGVDGIWFSLEVQVPYGDGVRRVRQIVRERDFFSSYNMFVSRDPLGIAGAPLGKIHSNRSVQFYFPNGLYCDSVSAVEGVSYKAGATAENTTIAGPYDPGREAITIDATGLDTIRVNTDPAYLFPEGEDIAIRFFKDGTTQGIEIERWTQPRTEQYTETVIVGYQDVNPHEVTYTYEEQVSTGFVTKTREIEVLDHYETYTEIVEEPVYVTRTRTVDVPVYRTETGTRVVWTKVWVPLEDAGGSAIGGDSGQIGEWQWQQVEETYTYQVVDHYEQQEETYQEIDHYEQVGVPRERAVYRTETEEYQEEQFETVTKTGTRIEYDQEPVYGDVVKTRYVPSELISTSTVGPPPNGLIFVGGNVRSIKGEVLDRMTVATRGSMKITGNIQYKDAEGDTAYLNGLDRTLPYEPNTAYDGRAVLGLIADLDIIYSRYVPANFEVNASMLSQNGRVGIEGVILDSNGEVYRYNKFYDEWGRRVGGSFSKDSIRRLGGITSYRRVIDTVVKYSSIVAGFKYGRSVYDNRLLRTPPPFFLARPVPTFFETEILQ